MKRQIVEFFKSDSLLKQIVGTVIAALIIWIITTLIGLFKGLDYYSSILWTFNILAVKVSFIWILILIVVFTIVIRRNNYLLLKKISKQSYSKVEINEKLEKKLDFFKFESFVDVYDYRRLKNHPWHHQYENNEIASFLIILRTGRAKSDYYKINNGIEGLVTELKEKKYVLSSMKNDILKEIKDCNLDDYSHHKEELEKILGEIEVL